MSFDLGYFKRELDPLLAELGANLLEARERQIGAKPFQVHGLSIDIEYGKYSIYPYDSDRATMKYRLNVGWNKHTTPQQGETDLWPNPKLTAFMGDSALDFLKKLGYSRVSGRGIGFLESDKSEFVRRVKKFLEWWNVTFLESEKAIAPSVSASSGSNRIYIVAGERNVELARATGKGLWVNVGQTARQVADRLRDDDYRKKAAGGNWVILYDQEVGNISDKEIHPDLKRHPRVEHVKSSNTEEFRFLDDPGDGSEAVKIVSQILSSRCVPLLKVENERLRQEVSQLQEKLDIIDDVIGVTGLNIERLTATVRENELLKTQLEMNTKNHQDWKDDETRKNEERIAGLEKRIQSDEQKFRAWKDDEIRENRERLLKIEKEKLTTVVTWSAITGVTLFCISWILAGNEHLEDLAKAQQERDIAYAALSTSDIQLKELQAKTELSQKKEVKEEAISVKTKPSKKRDTQISTVPAAKSASTPAPVSVAEEVITPTGWTSSVSAQKSVETDSAPKPASTPSIDLGRALARFDRCVQGASSHWMPLEHILTCNVGDDFEIKKCLYQHSGKRYATYRDAIFCWKQTH